MKLNDLPAEACGGNRFWKTTEDAVLRAHYATRGPDHCERLLARSRAAIYARARALGLKPPTVVRSGHPRRVWRASDEIDALIRAAWLEPSKGYAERVAAQVGRPKWWCCRRAMILGLSQPAAKQPAWTSQEEELLASLAHLGPATIARKLTAAGYRRSPTAIKVRLKRLGISCRQARLDEGLMTATQLADVMGVDVKTVLRWIDHEDLPATRRAAADEGRVRDYEIATFRLRGWLAGHAALVDLRKVDKFWFVDLAFGARS
jgi:hypothetical protein